MGIAFWKDWIRGRRFEVRNGHCILGALTPEKGDIASHRIGIGVVYFETNCAFCTVCFKTPCRIDLNTLLVTYERLSRSRFIPLVPSL